MSRVLSAAIISGIAMLPFVAVAHTSDIAMDLEGSAESQSYSLLSDNQVNVFYVEEDVSLSWNCACAAGSVGGAAGALAGGLIGFFGTFGGGSAVGAIIGGAVGTAIGEGLLHQGYHDIENKMNNSGGEPGVDHINSTE